RAPRFRAPEWRQATKLGRGGTQPLQNRLARLRPVRRRPVIRERRRFGVGVDVAELPVEADLEPRVAAGELLRGVAADALLGAAPDRLRDRRAATVGSKDPAPCSWHQ